MATNTIDIDWRTNHLGEPFTHVVSDEALRYFAQVPAGATLQQIADAFLCGYYVYDEDDDSAVTFEIEDDKGNVLTHCSGRPGGVAKVTIA